MNESNRAPAPVRRQRRGRHPGASSAALAACFGLGCTVPTLFPSFQIPEGEFRRTVDTICLWPVTVPDELPEAEEKARYIEQKLAKALYHKAFRVIVPKGLEQLWEQELERWGGYFDPHTGERLEHRYRSVRGAAYERFRTELGCHATLRAEVVPVVVRWSRGEAYWDGARRSMGSGLGDYYGTVEALSLYVTLRDLQHRELYFRAGGIQILYTLERDLSGARFVPVPRDRILARGRGLEHGIHLALAPLFSKPR